MNFFFVKIKISSIFKKLDEFIDRPNRDVSLRATGMYKIASPDVKHAYFKAALQGRSLCCEHKKYSFYRDT